jgi:hypothetical protein
MKAKHSLNGPLHFTHIIDSLLVSTPVEKQLDYISFPFICTADQGRESVLSTDRIEWRVEGVQEI